MFIFTFRRMYIVTCRSVQRRRLTSHSPILAQRPTKAYMYVTAFESMDTNTGPGHQSQSQSLGNSPSEEEMGHWTPTGIEPMDYDGDDDDIAAHPRVYTCK